MSSEASKRKLELPVQIGQDYDTEEVTKERTLWKRRRVFGTWTQNQIAVRPEEVTDAYMFSKVFDARFYARKIVTIMNRHATNGLTWKQQGSNDGITWHDVAVEAALAAANNITAVNNDAWAFLRVGVKNTVGAAVALAEAYITGQS